MRALIPEPPAKCPLCPRLVEYRAENEAQNPDWFNGAAPSFGDPEARLLVVGLAPGRTGANRTGRPFTGDHAGWLLYETLIKTGFARGRYDARPDDGLQLVGPYRLINSYHCSRLNTNTGRLTPAMFEDVFKRARQALTVTN